MVGLVVHACGVAQGVGTVPLVHGHVQAVLVVDMTSAF